MRLNCGDFFVPHQYRDWIDSACRPHQAKMDIRFVVNGILRTGNTLRRTYEEYSGGNNSTIVRHKDDSYYYRSSGLTLGECWSFFAQGLGNMQARTFIRLSAQSRTHRYPHVIRKSHSNSGPQRRMPYSYFLILLSNASNRIRIIRTGNVGRVLSKNFAIARLASKF